MTEPWGGSRGRASLGPSDMDDMTLDEAEELLAIPAGPGGGYNRNVVTLILAEVERDHG